MKKLLMKPVGGCINPLPNDSVCSSAFNTSKYIQWVPKDYSGNVDIVMYIDQAISDGLINEPFNDSKYGWLLESRNYNKHIIQDIVSNMDLYKSHYKHIFTCDMSLVSLGKPFVYSLSNGAPWTKLENRKKHAKTKLTSMLVSDNFSFPGHKYRVEYMRANASKLDLYGRGFNYVESTDEAFIDYMFTVSMENDVYDGYFTERLTSPMTTYTIPIYRGSKAVVEQYFNPKGVLFEDEIDLNDLNEDLYKSMIPYMEENFEIAYKFPVADDYIIENYFL